MVQFAEAAGTLSLSLSVKAVRKAYQNRDGYNLQSFVVSIVYTYKSDVPLKGWKGVIIIHWSIGKKPSQKRLSNTGCFMDNFLVYVVAFEKGKGFIMLTSE